MKSARKMNIRINRLSIQVVLLILIIVAMIEFISVTVIIIRTLTRLNISMGNEVIQVFMAKIAAINVSMILLFLVIVVLVLRVFRKINNYAFYSCTTGLPNKNYLMNYLMNKISDNEDFAALISLDMDDFKAVNDKLGHIAGDELLRLAGERFEQLLHKGDYVCHIGGDEFLFFIKSVKNRMETEQFVKNILDVFSYPFNIDGNEIDYVTGSIGIALMPKDGQDFQTLYNSSDDAMYTAKRVKRSSYIFYDKRMSPHLYEDLMKKKEIKEGIENKEFTMFYQPKFSDEGQLIGAEALARWIKPDGTILPPAEFISFAEKHGLILSLTDLIVDNVCRDLLSWLKKDPLMDFVVSVNITSEHITNEKLIRKLIEKIEHCRIPTKHVEFEITESMVIEDFEKAVENIALLKSYGITVSMDDFGTGYSSLNYLKKLPIDIIKIDKSFIDTINQDEKDKVLLKNIINIAHGFRLAVIAEGIESEEQLQVLKEMQCDMFQGYYFGKPVGKNDFESMFLKI